jgi:hypothetical protein
MEGLERMLNVGKQLQGVQAIYTLAQTLSSAVGRIFDNKGQ